MFEVRGKLSAGVQTAANLDEQSLSCGFAQVVGMGTEPIQFSRTHDSPFLDSRNEPIHGQTCCCQVEASKKAAVTEACIGDCPRPPGNRRRPCKGSETAAKNQGFAKIISPIDTVRYRNWPRRLILIYIYALWADSLESSGACNGHVNRSQESACRSVYPSCVWRVARRAELLIGVPVGLTSSTDPIGGVPKFTFELGGCLE
jgi:hypothetical protein